MHLIFDGRLGDDADRAIGLMREELERPKRRLRTNDCVWEMICCDECSGVDDCDRYVSKNSGIGSGIVDMYTSDVADAMRSVREKYVAIMEMGNTEEL